MNNGIGSQEKLAASFPIQESTILTLFINSLKNSSLTMEENFIEKSQFQELMSTLEITSFGTKLKRMFQKLLSVVHLFHSFSQINNGKTKDMLLWMVEPFTTLT